MKKFYALMTAVLAAASMSMAYAATADDAKNLSVLWDKVNVVRNATSARITVTAAIRTADGTTFNAQVYPVIHSTTLNIDYGSGTPQAVTLPTTGNVYQTSNLTWNFDALSAWGRDSNRTMYCIMKYNDVQGNPVEIGRCEVLRDGTTGIDDVTATPVDTATEVYTITGVRVAQGDNVDLNDLQPGMYIVRTGDTVKKIVR